MGVAMRYVEQYASSMPTERARHAAESAVWNLCSPRNAGSLDWPDGYNEWTWAELSQSLELTGGDSKNVVPAFRLASLIAVRVRAWVTMTLAAYGPVPAAIERGKRDWATAIGHHQRAQTFDIQAFRTKLVTAVQQEIGEEWHQNPAARSLVDRLVRKQEANKRATVQEFFNDASSFMQDKYFLVVTPCPECVRQQCTKSQIEAQELALPPFHLTCSCEVAWQHEWVFDEPDRSTENFEASIQGWLASSLKGLSIQPPSIRDLLSFEEARLRDKELLVCPVSSKEHSFWKRIVASLTGK
ncbi:MAG: hypothetical protein H6R17_2734 [Proteobacteria bacterium]|nr:hypothetical protein [Pseudomonadota bacterium]